MLCHVEALTAARLKDYLVREHGMLIRDASNFRGLTPHHFRVAAQTPPENEALFSALRQYLSSTPSL
jgi:threonine-phosphate decarboxylase